MPDIGLSVFNLGGVAELADFLTDNVILGLRMNQVTLKLFVHHKNTEVTEEKQRLVILP